MSSSVAVQDVHWADHWFVHFAPAAIGAFLTLLGFMVASRVVTRIVCSVGTRRSLDPDLTALMSRASRWTILAFGFVTAIGTIGIDVKALVASLGLTGFALGFALKDIISNSLAGVLILFYKPFHRGDHIDVAGSEGVVSSVDMRYTTLVVNEGQRILVPNSNLFTNTIRVTDKDRPLPPGP